MREEILKKLIRFEDNLVLIKEDLGNFPFDIDSPLVIVREFDLRRILKIHLLENKKMELIEDWANIIEGREDLDFESDKVREVIDKLANPVLYGEINKFRLLELLFYLDYGMSGSGTN